jgi:hypothetical protein
MNVWRKPLDASRKERTGWRDQEISSRHRIWGFDCPMRDVDFIVVEYHRGIAAAFVEYKHAGASKREIHSSQHAPLTTLQTHGRDLPFFVVVYDPDTWWFTVHTKNSAAIAMVAAWLSVSGIEGDGDMVLTEHDYVWLLYHIRGVDFFANRKVDRTILTGYTAESPAT